MKINNQLKANAVRKVDSAKVAEKATPKDGSTASDRVELSSKAELEELKQMAMEQPPNEVDLQRLKSAIRNGDYKPDVGRLADRLLSDPGTVDKLLAD